MINAVVLLEKQESEQEWLTPTEAAKILHVDPRTVLRRIADKSLPARKEGPRMYRVRRRDLDEYIQKSMIEPE